MTMETQPLVSVIMPCYNMEKYLPATIASVQRQTFPDWELIVVDDISSDKTPAVLQDNGSQDPRIRWVVQEEHSGIASARNRAIQMAQGRFLAFLDADDLWQPEKLERQLAFMQERDIAFSYSSYDCVDEDGRHLNKTVKATEDMDYEAYLRNTIIGCSTVMIDTLKVESVVVPDFRTSEDTATWLDILRKGFIAYAIEEPLVSYRIRRKSASSNKLKAAADLWKVYRQHERMPFFKAVACFSSYAFHAIKKHFF